MKKLMIMLLILSLSAFASQKLTRDKNGIVTDPNTGLQWQDIYSESNNTANPNGRMRVEKTLKKAIQYCEDLNIAGLSDWRLPNYNELFSLVDFSASNIALKKGFTVTDLTNAATFENGKIVPISNLAQDYYTSTTYISNKTPYNTKKYVWGIDFESNNGYINNKGSVILEKTGASGGYSAVRCVRTTTNTYHSSTHYLVP